MKFIVGFLGGLVVGAAGAVAYSMQTGKDLREVVDDVRSDLSKTDLDALGARLETRFGEMQKDLETRITAVREKAQSAMDEAGSKASDVGDTAGDALDKAADAAQTTADSAADTVAEVQDAVEDQGGA